MAEPIHVAQQRFIIVKVNRNQRFHELTLRVMNSPNGHELSQRLVNRPWARKGENSMSYLGEEIKKLGFGLMRLPKKDGKIDIDETKEMVDLFLEKGFTYFDTAYVYDDGKSEEAICEALVKRYPRESYQLATSKRLSNAERFT